jgi:hypothetical protein
MNATATRQGIGLGPAKPRPYLPMALMAAVIAVAGFWPKYFSKMAALAPDSPWYIHIHAAVFSGWLAIFALQAWLAANRQLRLHRRLGTFAFAYGALLIAVGWMTALQVFRQGVLAGDVTAASKDLYVPFTDLLFFAPVLAAAWAFRHRPEVHKRLIVVATTILLIAAVHRFVGHNFGRPPSLALVLPLWLSPILLGMAVDWVHSRRVYIVYVFGIGIILAMKFRPRLRHTDWWNSFTAFLASTLT